MKPLKVHRFDVIVIGAGVIGLSIAYELAKQGRRVGLLERGAGPGCESSNAAAGILAPEEDAQGPGPFLDLCLRSWSLFPALVRTLERETRIPLGYRRSGLLSLAQLSSDEAELETRYRWQRACRLRVSRLTARQVRSLEPAVDGRLRWALFYHDDHQIDNARFTQALAMAAQKRGVRIFFGHEVRHILVRSHRVCGAEGAQGRFESPVVVDAAGSWANLDGRLGFQVPVVPAKGQMVALQMARPLFKRIVKSKRAYLVSRRGGRLLVGATVEFAGFDKTVTANAVEGLIQGAREISSRVGSAEFRETWAGLRPCSQDRFPILGPTPMEGFFVAAGHFRDGILLAPLTGKVMADLIVRGKAPLDLKPFALERFFKES